MRAYKLLLKEIEQPILNDYGYVDKDAIKLGEVAVDFKGKTDDYDFDFKKGDKVYYQYGNKGVLNGEELILVSLTNLVKDYE